MEHTSSGQSAGADGSFWTRVETNRSSAVFAAVQLTRVCLGSHSSAAIVVQHTPVIASRALSSPSTTNSTSSTETALFGTGCSPAACYSRGQCTTLNGSLSFQYLLITSLISSLLLCNRNFLLPIQQIFSSPHCYLSSGSLSANGGMPIFF